MMDLQDTLKNSYIEWLKNNITTKNIDGVIEITSPLLDRHNDFLQIYVVPTDGKLFKLTDDGYIISDLKASGCDIKGSKRRKEIFRMILNGYGIQSDGEELFVLANLDDFPQKKHLLLQAMLSVNDMFLTSRSVVQSLFYEDVENFLIDKDIRFTDNVNFTGKSGFIHKFDFVIPRSKNGPERIIQTINNPSRERSESLLFAWNDTKDTRKEGSTLYAFLNDKDKNLNKEIISAFTRYDVKTILWSKKNSYIDELSA